MDEVLIAPRELILAALGIGLALLMLLFLSIYQKSRARDAGEERLEKVREERRGMAEALAGTSPFFIACFNGNNPRFFRVYSGADELLFLYAGQYYAMIDADSPRGTDERHWLMRSLKMLYVALGCGAVAASIGVAAVVRGVVRNAANNPEGASHILLGVLGIIAFMAVLVVIIVPSVLWEITRRCRELDELPLSRLREDAELHPKSFRATPDTVEEWNISLLDQRANFFPSSEVGSIISFKHGPTGRWKIETLTNQDTQDAIRAILAVWDREKVQIDNALLNRFKAQLSRPELDK